MTQKAAWLIDAGQDAGLAANSAKYAAAEAAVHAVDQAIQTHGGNGLSQEYGVAALLAMSRVSRIAPGQPRDDPQLRRPARPAAPPLLLTPRCRNSQCPRAPEDDDDVRARASTPASTRRSRPRRRRSTRPCSPSAAERGDHPALIDGISGQTITYAQLAQMVDRMAAGFAENGVQARATSSRCTARTPCSTRWSSTRRAGRGPR